MQTFDEMANGLMKMLSQYDVAEVSGSALGFVVRLKTGQHLNEVSQRFPRYRGLSVRVEVAQRSYTFLGTYAKKQDESYIAKCGVFTASVSPAKPTAGGVMWAPKLYVVRWSSCTRPLGSIDLPLRKTIRGAFRAAENAARAYRRAVRKSFRQAKNADQ